MTMLSFSRNYVKSLNRPCDTKKTTLRIGWSRLESPLLKPKVRGDENIDDEPEGV